MLNAASPPSTRPDGTQNPHVVTELQMTLDDINVIFCAVAVEVGGRFVYRERKAEENEIKIKCSHRHLCFATVDAERVLAAASPPPWTILLATRPCHRRHGRRRREPRQNYLFHREAGSLPCCWNSILLLKNNEK